MGIAEFLGLDASSYRSTHSSSNTTEYEAGNPPISDEERFQSCERFQFKCPDKDCSADVTLDDVFRKQENGQIEFSLSRCVNPNCKVSPLNHVPYILNRLTQALRKNIHRYYSVSSYLFHTITTLSGSLHELPSYLIIIEMRISRYF